MPGVVEPAELQMASPMGLEDEPSLLAEIAASLWKPDYGAWFKIEVEQNRAALGIPSDAVGSVQSRYARRLKGEQLAAWQRKQQNRERDRLAIELHSNNMRHWSPSLIARSIAYFNLTSSWMHSVESGQRRLASRPTIFKVLRLMRDLRPRPEFDEGEHISVYGFDQTYEWVGMAKRGRRQASCLPAL